MSGVGDIFRKSILDASYAPRKIDVATCAQLTRAALAVSSSDVRSSNGGDEGDAASSSAAAGSKRARTPASSTVDAADDEQHLSSWIAKRACHRYYDTQRVQRDTRYNAQLAVRDNDVVARLLLDVHKMPMRMLLDVACDALQCVRTSYARAAGGQSDEVLHAFFDAQLKRAHEALAFAQSQLSYETARASAVMIPVHRFCDAYQRTTDALAEQFGVHSDGDGDTETRKSPSPSSTGDSKFFYTPMFADVAGMYANGEDVARMMNIELHSVYAEEERAELLASVVKYAKCVDLAYARLHVASQRLHVAECTRYALQCLVYVAANRGSIIACLDDSTQRTKILDAIVCFVFHDEMCRAYVCGALADVPLRAPFTPLKQRKRMSFFTCLKYLFHARMSGVMNTESYLTALRFAYCFGMFPDARVKPPDHLF